MIGYVNQLESYFRGEKPKEAQTIPASLFYRKNETMGIEGIPFDLFISEKHKLAYKVGDHPLQNGVTISDHVKRELREVTIDGLFTNHPIKKNYKSGAVTFASEYATEKEKSTITNEALAKFEKLKDLADRKSPVRLVCSLDIYPKMIITSIDYERNEKSGSSIRFSVTLREIVTVGLRSISESIAFSPKSMEPDMVKMTAELKKMGKNNAQIKEAKEMAQLEDVKVMRADQ